MKRRSFLALAGITVADACVRGAGRASGFTAFGSQGLRDGQFIRPRAAMFGKGELYVIDTTGRVQVFDPDGKFLRGWPLPASENGTPTGLCLNNKDVIVIPDTHYSRVLEYTNSGELLRQWGAYGSGPDQFIYPTGVAEAGDGLYFISEYGENAERVHVFDADGNFVRQWGEHGTDPGQFSRAMALDLDDDTIYVADTANHRVQCFDHSGKLLSVISGPGTGPGRLKDPYDMCLATDGTIFVAEYGTHRISRFARSGEFIACYGRPGRGPGEFNGPRGVAVSPDGVVYVSDTDNHRVQRFVPGKA